MQLYKIVYPMWLLYQIYSCKVIHYVEKLTQVYIVQV